MNNQSAIYNFYVDNKLLGCGTVNELSKRYHIPVRSLRNWCRKNTYSIKRKRWYYLENTKKTKTYSTDKEYEYVLRHLELYGNVVVVKEPSKIVEMLNKNGIKVNVVHYPRKKSRDIYIDDNSREDWILEKI